MNKLNKLYEKVCKEGSFGPAGISSGEYYLAGEVGLLDKKPEKVKILSSKPLGRGEFEVKVQLADGSKDEWSLGKDDKIFSLAESLKEALSYRDVLKQSESVANFGNRLEKSMRAQNYREAEKIQQELKGSLFRFKEMLDARNDWQD